MKTDYAALVDRLEDPRLLPTKPRERMGPPLNPLAYDDLVPVIQHILITPSLQQQLAECSYRHSNSFDKIVLATAPKSQLKLRLHLWWKSNDTPATICNIHNHRWDFVSVLLLGNLHIEEYSVGPNGTESYHYQYRSPEDEDHYSVRFLGTKKLTCIYNTLISKGSSYELPHTTLHRALPVGEESVTATLFLQGPVMKLETDVFTQQKIRTPRYIPARRFRADELSDRLSRFLTELNRHRS